MQSPGLVIEGQIRLTSRKVSVMLHSQSGRHEFFFDLMHQNIETAHDRKHIKDVYFPTSREQEAQLATKEIRNIRWFITAHDCKKFPRSSRLVLLLFGCSVYAFAWYCRNTHKRTEKGSLLKEIWYRRFRIAVCVVVQVLMWLWKNQPSTKN